MLARLHAPTVRRLIELHPVRNGSVGVGDLIDDEILPRLQTYANALSDQAYANLMARLPQLTDDLRPYVRQLAEEARPYAQEFADAAVASDGVQKAREELKQAFVTTTAISVGASFAAAFLAEWWGAGRRHR